MQPSPSDPLTHLSTARCNVCGGTSPRFDGALILGQYPVDYFCCDVCGFVQTTEPFWLDQAYSAAIANQDVGIMQRNLNSVEVASAVLNLLFPEAKACIDFGAGHGIFVRMMRDRGFNFFWSDLHASNDYARGFEATPGTHYDFLTAFELAEHLLSPTEGFAQLMDLADNLFLSTFLVPSPRPAVSDWWYYAPATGQHIAFYTPAALQKIADRFGRHLLSVGSYHLFSKKPQNKTLFAAAARVRSARIINLFHPHTSLVQSDLQKLMT